MPSGLSLDLSENDQASQEAELALAQEANVSYHANASFLATAAVLADRGACYASVVGVALQRGGETSGHTRSEPATRGRAGGRPTSSAS